MGPQMGPLAFFIPTFLLSKLLSRFSLGDVIKIMIAMISCFSNVWTQTPYAYFFRYHVHLFWSYRYSTDRCAHPGVTAVTCRVLPDIPTGGWSTTKEGKFCSFWEVSLLRKFFSVSSFFMKALSSLSPCVTMSHIIIESELLCLQWLQPCLKLQGWLCNQSSTSQVDHFSPVDFCICYW